MRRARKIDYLCVQSLNKLCLVSTTETMNICTGTVRLEDVISVIDKTISRQWGTACTDAVQTAIKSLPSNVSSQESEASLEKNAAFQRVFAQSEDLFLTMDSLARWMKDAERDDIVELLRISKHMSAKTRQLAELNVSHLSEQLKSIRASMN